MPINFDTAFGIHDDALLVRTQRARAIAANLANADTPHYKARDLDFRKVLGSVTDGTAATVIRTTHARHLRDEESPFTGAELLYRVPNQPSIDGNTVDPNVEKAAFMSNAVRYQASLRFLSGKIKTLVTAIRGD
jgi:flagellar basal-body rod protein FlgB